MSLPPLVALEVGTTKTRAIIGEAKEDGHLMITGLGECPSRGVRKSEIIHVDNATACTRAALHQAEEHGNVYINRVHLLLSGGHIHATSNRGSVPVHDAGGEISPYDMEHAMETARAVNLAPDREVLHTICQHFVVDDQQGVMNPEDMIGGKLAVDMLILHGVGNRLRNTVKAVRSIPMDVEDVAFGGLCAALAVLSPDQKERGAIVLDLGGGTTDFVVYAGNAIASAGSFAVGGDHVTNDISRGLRVPLAEAEKLKETSGSAMHNVASRSQRISIHPEGSQGEQFVRVSDLNAIIHCRMEELFTLVREHLVQKGLLDMLGAGIVLTGGGAYMNGALDLAENVFGLPCAKGVPRNVSGLAVATEGPEYAAPIGLLRYGQRTLSRKNTGSGFGGMLRGLFGGKHS